MKPSLLIILVMLFAINPARVFAQTQHIHIIGVVYDIDHRTVKGANISALFNNNVLAAAPSDTNGFYHLEYEVNGGISSVDLIAEYQGENIKIVQNVPVTQNETWVNIEVSSVNGAYITYLDNRIKPPVQYTFRRNYGGSHYVYTRGRFDPIFYNKKVSCVFKIVGKKEMPVSNAKVEVIIPDDEQKPRWGITDENGYLIMHMDFENGALDGKIHISADGYRKRKLLFQKFNANNTYTFKLRKAH